MIFFCYYYVLLYEFRMKKKYVEIFLHLHFYIPDDFKLFFFFLSGSSDDELNEIFSRSRFFFCINTFYRISKSSLNHQMKIYKCYFYSTRKSQF